VRRHCASVLCREAIYYSRACSGLNDLVLTPSGLPGADRVGVGRSSVGEYINCFQVIYACFLAWCQILSPPGTGFSCDSKVGGGNGAFEARGVEILR